jgi:hypothetical protein
VEKMPAMGMRVGHLILSKKLMEKKSLLSEDLYLLVLVIAAHLAMHRNLLFSLMDFIL